MRSFVVLLLAAAAGIALVYAVATGLDDRAGPPIVIDDPLVGATVVVSVDGAVATPGLYAFPAEARVGDAVARAGGFAANADLASVNLARRLRDEDKIVVASLVPAPVPATTGAAEDAPVGRTAATAGGRVDLNRATAEELDALPGIGPVLAQRIVDARTANGPFVRVDDLAKVQGISPRMVDELRPLVEVGP